MHDRVAYVPSRDYSESVPPYITNVSLEPNLDQWGSVLFPSLIRALKQTGSCQLSFFK